MLYVSQDTSYPSLPSELIRAHRGIGIYQDSLEDWEEAAGVMGCIHEDAVFTIAAASGRDSNAGLRPVHELEHLRYVAMPVPNLFLRTSIDTEIP